MARAKQYKGTGLGRYLVGWAIGKAYTLSEEIGCRIVFLECEDHNVGFYQKTGFELIPRRPKDKRNVMFIDLLDTICLKCGFVNSRDKETCDKCGSQLKPI